MFIFFLNIYNSNLIKFRNIIITTAVSALKFENSVERHNSCHYKNIENFIKNYYIK